MTSHAAPVSEAEPPPAPPAASVGLLGRREKRFAVWTLQVLVLAAIIVALGVSGNWGEFFHQYFDWERFGDLFGDMLRTGLVNTLIYTATAFAIGLGIGLVVALMKISSNPLFKVIANIWIEIFRGLPALLVLFMIGFGIPLLYGNSGVWSNFYFKAAIALGFVASAYIAETIRAGIQAVPKGQMEAARTLGMKPGRAMVTVVLPQAFRLMIPPMTNQVIALVKDTSLVYTLGVTVDQYELTKLSNNAATGAISGYPASPTYFILAGLFYLVITVPLAILVTILERRQANRRY